VSAEIDDLGVGDAVLGLGFRYTLDTASGGILFGLGYQATDTNGNAAGGGRDVIGFSAAAKLGNGLSTAFNYSQLDVDGWANNQTHTAIGLSYATGAITLHANYGIYEDVGGVANAESKGWALAAQYDLGGGAKVQFGYADGSRNFGAPATRDAQIWSLGVAMAF
jgi:outer membrane protein OmpU